MLVYGDRSRIADPRTEIAALLDRIAQAERRPAGLERHAALVASLIACGELAQGLADAAMGVVGVDAPDPATDLSLQATRALADAVVSSWRSRFSFGPIDLGPLQALASTPLPERVTLKEGEGYAFYALYPETYAEAASALPAARTTVIGVRSIGTSLGAVVASALGAERFVTVRPAGHPFRRTLACLPSLPAAERVAVVDEGPGLSGSSFGAVLDRAEAAGVPRSGLVAFPSHAGDLGPEAAAVHRGRWSTLLRPHVGFDAAIAPRLAAWVEDLTGPAIAPLQDLSGGAWRALRYACEADWPAVNAAQERRKFLLHSKRGAFLLKFAGLGAVGERKLARARRLGAAGFTVPPLGLRHGFLVEPWIGNFGTVRELSPLFGDRLVSYLSYLAKLHAPPEAGADLPALLHMTEVNVAGGLGPRAAEALEPWRRALPRLAPQVRRVVTDNRLHPHEWIATADGRMLKTDALDHAEAHDLIGCQDIAWDVAGAAVEFDLDPDEADELWRAVDAGRRGADFLGFHRIVYLAFQLGATIMAADAHAGWPEEARRLASARDAYAEKLRRTLRSA